MPSTLAYIESKVLGRLKTSLPLCIQCTFLTAVLYYMQGCDTFTFSPAVMQQLVDLPETLQAATDFEDAAARNGAEW